MSSLVGLDEIGVVVCAIGPAVGFIVGFIVGLGVGDSEGLGVGSAVKYDGASKMHRSVFHDALQQSK